MQSSMSFLAFNLQFTGKIVQFWKFYARDLSETKISAKTNIFVSNPVPDGEREAELRSHVHEELVLLLLRTKADYSLQLRDPMHFRSVQFWFQIFRCWIY
jgi:hypothetical protein